MTPNEYDLYMFVRHGANPYGVASTGLKSLEADFGRRGWHKNYINKLLLSLRSKRYLHYRRRSGRRGSFEIHFPEFLTPSGQITGRSLKDGRGEEQRKTTIFSEVKEENKAQTPRSGENATPISREIAGHRLNSVRVPYTDTENIPKHNRFFKELPTSFVPCSYEEERCREIAIALEETSMAYLLGVLRKHGLRPIEHAWGIYGDVKDKHLIENKGAYFNRILSNLLDKSE